MAFVAIPKEKLFDELPEQKIATLPEKWGIKDKGDFTLKEFIRRIRNSISHGNMDVSDDLIFTFRDVNPKNNKDIFSCELQEDELRHFIHAFAWWIMTNKIE